MIKSTKVPPKQWKDECVFKLSRQSQHHEIQYFEDTVFLHFGLFHCFVKKGIKTKTLFKKEKHAQRHMIIWSHVSMYYSCFSFALIETTLSTYDFPHWQRSLPVSRHTTNNANINFLTPAESTEMRFSCCVQCLDCSQGEESMEEDGPNVVQQQQHDDAPGVRLRGWHHSARDFSSSVKGFLKSRQSRTIESASQLTSRAFPGQSKRVQSLYLLDVLPRHGVSGMALRL